MDYTFYDEVLKRAETLGVLNKEMSILVVAGGHFDRLVLQRNGYQNVVISNIGKQKYNQMVSEASDDYSPYRWRFEDAEHLTAADAEYDVVIEHLGLHHCRSPHAGLLEMYRAAKRAVIFIENRDSLLLRLAKRLGLSSDYEIEAVVGNDFEAGGVSNSSIPNYVYRWREHEVEKAISSYDPTAKPVINYLYALRFPVDRLRFSKNKIKVMAGITLSSVLKVISVCFPKQCNMLGVIIQKPQGTERSWPWLTPDSSGSLTINRVWCEQHYHAKPSEPDEH